MADPITGFGLAANVIQFLEFGGKLFDTSRQIYRRGALQDYTEIQLVAKDLRNLATSLEKSSKQQQDNDQCRDADTLLQSLSIECQNICNDLLEILDELEAQSGDTKRTKRKSFYVAIRTLWKTERIENLRRRMSEMRQELITHIIISLR